MIGGMATTCEYPCGVPLVVSKPRPPVWREMLTIQTA
jgi:hypothetical protein